MKKVLVMGAYAAAVVILIINRDSLVSWMEADLEGYQHILMWLAGLIIAVVPALPYGIVAAVFGAKYGLLTGSLLNIGISVLGAIILFALVRRTFSQEERAKASKVKGLHYLTDFTENHAFLTILIARLLPIVPAQAVAIFAAITKIAWIPYLSATILGKIPFLLFITLLGDRFYRYESTNEIFMIVIGYGMFLAVVYVIYRRYWKSKVNNHS
ncbi:TVP38/TMEM64 family protein [Cohnella algarum]|uniref:TVP38/TMEM64 family protein n=1 Tax=Cohnella algarum TaxID=2044859 RepID=UPI001966F101|nr:VTT domain-containing protein [Cohnella algarum]MBN2981804.1 VTT domain-containing protein [Cohnella algarum]